MGDIVYWGETHLADKTEWRFGPPPSIGWWDTKFPGGWQPARRYWDGNRWSHFLRCGSFADALDAMSNKSQYDTDEIEWRGLKRPSEEEQFRAKVRRAIQMTMKGNQ